VFIDLSAVAYTQIDFVVMHDKSGQWEVVLFKTN